MKNNACICDAITGATGEESDDWCGGHKALLRSLMELPAMSTSTFKTDQGDTVLCVIFDLTDELLMSVTYDKSEGMLVLMDRCGQVVNKVPTMVELIRSVQTLGQTYMGDLKKQKEI